MAAQWLGEDEHFLARLPRIPGPGARRLDVGQQLIDPLVAGLAMVIPLADLRERARERGAAAQEEERGVVMRVEDGPGDGVRGVRPALTFNASFRDKKK